jgi:hypothetical protein
MQENNITSDNDPDGHNTFAFKPRSASSFDLQMYCGLHFQFGLMITREIPCIAQKIRKTIHFQKYLA